jgi:beta-lactamase class A
MLGILFEQKFRDKIPAKLPATVKVANKTGSISNVEHDSGIVYLPDGRKYVLVMLSRELPDSSYGTEILAEISKIIYEKLYSNK